MFNRSGRKKYGGQPSYEQRNGTEQDARPVIGAKIISVEAHLRRSSMYRITLQLQYAAEDDPDGLGLYDLIDSPRAETLEPSVGSWKDEVDALIAHAQTAAEPGEAVLTVHEDTLVSWRLLKGKLLSAEEYAKLLQQEQKEEAYRSALAMLERKARTTAELERALKRKEFSQEAIAGCVERLQANRMVDDSAFARRFTEQRAVNQRKGRMLIRQELMQRGVSRPEIDQAIGELEPGIEEQSALALARKKWPTVKGNDRERKQKLMAMLMRRGYTGSVVRTAVQQAAAESNDSSNEDDAEWNDVDESFD
ncbi:regulatory protein RecX [Cohnella yongneupensis]|uniref:Regulatory protein RecX n=1 Tax=Cohnella yongneupensis TaxID=425006 RepID=A0ABW0R6R9_9BACL